MPRSPRQLRLPPDTLGTVTRRLRERYSSQPARARRPTEPLEALIRLILAQQNTAEATGRQYRALRERYPHWEMALLDGPDGIEVTLRAAGGGLSRVKSEYLYQLLTDLEARGEISLRFLYGLSPSAARRTLQAFSGVGQNTSSLFLLFELGFPAIPVEINILRVLKRLEWVEASWTAQKTVRWLSEVLPPDWDTLYHFHLSFVRHGRQVCLPKPRCEGCLIRQFCPAAALFLPEG